MVTLCLRLHCFTRGHRPAGHTDASQRLESGRRSYFGLSSSMSLLVPIRLEWRVLVRADFLALLRCGPQDAAGVFVDAIRELDDVVDFTGRVVVALLLATTLLFDLRL